MLNVYIYNSFEYIKNILEKYTLLCKKKININFVYNQSTDVQLFYYNYTPFSYDVMMIDIDDLFNNYMEFLTSIRKLDSSISLILFSSHLEAVVNVIPFRIIGFIPKDTSTSFICSSLESSFLKYLEYSDNRIVFQSIIDHNLERMCLSIDDIYFITCSNKTSYIYTEINSYAVYKSTFKEITSNLISPCFFESHRSCIVNTKKISSYSRNTITLNNNYKIPLSRGKYITLENIFSHNN